MLVVGVLAPAGPAGAGSRSFELVSLETVATVHPDTTMEVVEEITYRYDGGPFNFGIRSFEFFGDISDFTARDGEGPLEVIPPESSVSGDWEWALRRPTSDATVTYVLTYTVRGAVTVGRDVADLNWQFLGSEHPGVGSVDITVRFPDGIPPARADVTDDDTTVLRGFAHGPTNGVVRVDESLVVATVDRVGSGRFVEIRALAPADAFTVTGDEELLADALVEERRIAGEQEEDAEQERRRGLLWPLTGVLSAVGLLGTGALWYSGGRERKSQEVLGEYWREPLDERPAVAVTNLSRGTVPTGAAIAGTVVDMAQRGYLRIVGEREERFGPDKTVHRYVWAGKEYGDDVLPYEKAVLEMIFRGKTEVTSDEVDAWARKHQSSAQAKLKTITKGITAEYERHGYEVDAAHNPLLKVLIGVCVAVAVAGFALTRYTGRGAWWVPVAGAFVLFVAGGRLLKNRTQAGAEAAAKAKGLKAFLKDFSRLEDAPVGHLILWERYLVYSVALGVSAELMRGLTTRVPAVANDPNFGVWYRGPSGHFDGFDRMETHGSSLVSASTPKNTSGSGGGFSGGGSSGGGGGGGFGAR